MRMDFPAILAALAGMAAFAAGSIPFGLLLGKMAGRDVRSAGSGNIGATNVWRVCGWKYGLAAFVLDFAKGLLPAALPGLLLPPNDPATATVTVGCGLAAVLGHCFSPWLKMRGGKGVATAAGATAYCLPWAFLAAAAAFALVLAWKRYVSLGSITAATVLMLASPWWRPLPVMEKAPLVGLAALLCLLVWWTHRANIRRLLNGTENRVGQRKPESSPPAEK